MIFMAGHSRPQDGVAPYVLGMTSLAELPELRLS